MKTSAAVSTFTLMVAGLAPALAHADTLNFTITNANQTVTQAGTVLTYTGLVSAPTTNTGIEYLNSDNFTLVSPGTLDDSIFYNGPAQVAKGQSFTFSLFTVTVPAHSAPATYQGSFQILGEDDPVGVADNFLTGQLASANFYFTVQPAATSPVPEPSSLALLGTGAMGLLGVARRRFAGRSRS